MFLDYDLGKKVVTSPRAPGRPGVPAPARSERARGDLRSDRAVLAPGGGTAVLNRDELRQPTPAKPPGGPIWRGHRPAVRPPRLPGRCRSAIPRPDHPGIHPPDRGARDRQELAGGEVGRSESAGDRAAAVLVYHVRVGSKTKPGRVCPGTDPAGGAGGRPPPSDCAPGRTAHPGPPSPPDGPGVPGRTGHQGADPPGDPGAGRSRRADRRAGDPAPDFGLPAVAV